MVSIIIPSRNERFLLRTVEDLLEKATGNYEIIAGLDGYWPDPALPNHPRIRHVHNDEALGMRQTINKMVKAANGEFIIKVDGHCLFDKGFNEALAGCCENNTVITPRQYALDGDTWTINKKRKKVDYWLLEAPKGIDESGRVLGFNGVRWFDRTGPDIDDQMIFQGSCWCMRKSHFNNLGLLDDINYGHFSFEASEISLKTWLSGGKVLVNKNTWYAHLHKGRKYGRGYFLSKSCIIKSGHYSLDLWFNNKWPRQIRPLKWLVDHFSPAPTWENFDWSDKKWCQ